VENRRITAAKPDVASSIEGPELRVAKMFSIGVVVTAVPEYLQISSLSVMPFDKQQTQAVGHSSREVALSPFKGFKVDALAGRALAEPS